MYDYLFIFFYKFFEWRKEDDPKDAAIYGVMVPIFFHLFCLLTAIIYFTGRNHLQEAFGTNHSKYFWLPEAALVMFIINWIFKRRADRILVKYKDDPSVFTTKHIVWSLFITLAPFALGVYFLNSR